MDPNAPEASTPDAGPTRPFHLASTGTQLRLDQGLRLTDADLATDVDAIAIHQDFYGLPWEAFENGTEPPAEWAAAMDALREHARAASKPVFLSLQLVGGPNRRFLADRTRIEQGKVEKDEGWSAECYDFRTAPDAASKRAAYVAYVEHMVRLFEPVWVNIAIEMNLFMTCGDAWDGLVEVERVAYAAAKAARPEVIAFPSFQIDALYGYNDAQCPAGSDRSVCFDAAYQRLERVERDRFAISTYPHMIDAFDGVSAIPDDWFTRAAARADERIVIAEAGWNSTPARGVWRDGSCITAIDSDESTQLTYFDRLVHEAETHGMDLVTWWSNRDLVVAPLMTDCPCGFDATWCSVLEIFRQAGGTDPEGRFYGEMILKVWGTMGIRDYEGAPKRAIFDRWQAVRAVPPAPP